MIGSVQETAAAWQSLGIVGHKSVENLTYQVEVCIMCTRDSHQIHFHDQEIRPRAFYLRTTKWREPIVWPGENMNDIHAACYGSRRWGAGWQVCGDGVMKGLCLSVSLSLIQTLVTQSLNTEYFCKTQFCFMPQPQMFLLMNSSMIVALPRPASFPRFEKSGRKWSHLWKYPSKAEQH